MAIAWKDRPLLDEKMALHEDFRFNGVKGGPEWKENVKKAIMSRAPVMRIILEWAEEMDTAPISEQLFLQAVGTKLSEEQVQVVNASIWGFLAKAVSGPAQTIFNSAETLNALDAWRRVIVFISQGKEIRLDNLRSEVKVLQFKQIPSLERVEEGVAEFINILTRYEKAGGTVDNEQVKKSDLLSVLPGTA